MPKISAATVAEHREQVRGALVDASEAILRAGDPLTAGAVSSAAGIARNSIYRYVDRVDDLRGLVLERYLPAWDEAVSGALASVSDPGERIVVWVRVNLEQALSTGHSWLMDISRGSGTSTATTAVAEYAHRILRDPLGSAWLELEPDPTEARIQSALTLGLLEAAFQRLESDLPSDRLIDATVRAARALVESSRRG
ncbi:TetR/AcrR family transcriptional regulator [Tessaracoccus sp. HDW20]|uniref:TetR/AcrR family transcriptional regulator n=1 Tax=Tessaracoccus coleopterorum TaxID=2714950 RepID=UPI0018D28824|nr:TetR/AcrR family transcriptional regulator [Tessaracoccus coleopterorum]NHB85459.1 TetR/AcrR family transcriptional regulator [Tessaracoccus coleopterorum]